METETLSSFTYMNRNFCNLSTGDDSSGFSDCNSDRSGEFPTSSDTRRRLLLACATENSDELIRRLVSDLESCSIEAQRTAALEIRLLAKEDKKENRMRIARAGAIKPLVSLLQSPDSQLQEYGVTAILNLSLCDENKDLITASGAVKPLVRALKTGSPTTKENAAVALLRLSQIDENKITIGSAGAIPPLVNLLENGSLRGKKDAAAALYVLCSLRDNKIRAVQAGIMKPLVELMADFGSGMVDKAAYVCLFIAFALAASASAGTCDSGLYKALAPLAAHPPALAFCAKKFPQSTRTVTAGSVPRLRRDASTKSTTNATTKAVTTSVVKIVTTTISVATTRAPSTSAASDQARKIASTTTKKDGKEVLWSSISAQAGAVLSTLCSCFQPPKTITIQPTTTTCSTSSCRVQVGPEQFATRFFTPCIEPRPTICDSIYTTPSTTTSSTTAASCGIGCTVQTIANVRGAPECTQLASVGLSCGVCAIDALRGYTGTCQTCSGQTQVCNQDSDCCEPDKNYCDKGSSNYGWCFSRR